MPRTRIYRSPARVTRSAKWSKNTCKWFKTNLWPQVKHLHAQNRSALQILEQIDTVSNFEACVQANKTFFDTAKTKRRNDKYWRQVST